MNILRKVLKQFLKDRNRLCKPKISITSKKLISGGRELMVNFLYNELKYTVIYSYENGDLTFSTIEGLGYEEFVLVHENIVKIADSLAA